MDYAFAPLPDHQNNPFYVIYRRMFPHRQPQTTLINQDGLTRVEDFLDHVETEPGLSRPVGSFLIASHGNDQGFIEMEIDAVSHQDPDGNRIVGTTYEVLVSADNNNTVEIPDALTNPRPAGSPPTAVFHIRGCNVGRAEPFMQKFKAVLGGNVLVSAPRHFDNNRAMGQGAFEYLGYNFKLIRRDEFATRNQVVAAFRDRVPAFTFIDGSAVPNANWNRWIPNNHGVGRRNLGRGNRNPFVNFGQQVEGQPRIRLGQFRHNDPPGVARYSYTLGLDADPGEGLNRADKHAARLQTLRDRLELADLFQPGHAFPEYERYGYVSVQDFVDGYRWAFNWNADAEEGPQLVCNGRRHVYVVIPAVTDPATDNLLFNYYPDNDDPARVIETLSALEVTNPPQFQELFQVV